MKIALALLALVGMSFAAPATRSLRNDIDDFLALIPREEIIEVYHRYENDADVQRILAYLRSDDFAAVIHIVVGVPEVQDLVQYLEERDIQVIALLNRIADRLGLPHYPVSRSLDGSSTNSRSLRDFIDEIVALIPINDIVMLALDKLGNSPDFQELYLKIASIDGPRLHDQALSHPEIADLVQRINGLGIDTKRVWNIVAALFGWSTRSVYATRGLSQDLDDFLALLPTEELIELFRRYENDPDVRAIIAYIQSEDFAAVVHIVAHNPEIQGLVDWIESRGVNIIELLNRLADRLGLPHWPSNVNRSVLRSSRSVQDFLDEALALIPVNQILGLALEKLANSDDFQELYLRISALPGQQLHDDALSHPEIQDLVNRLNRLGFDTTRAWNLAKILFGW